MKTAHPVILEWPCFTSSGRFLSAIHPPTLRGSSRASQSRESLEHEVGKRISWWKKWACWRYSFYSGARIKSGIPPKSHAIPSPRRPRTLEDDI